MIILLDANILVRTADPSDPLNAITKSCLIAHAQKAQLIIVPQSLFEFWVVATRPRANNGLGLTSLEANREIIAFQSYYPLLRDQHNLYDEWQSIVNQYQCLGKTAHDAKYVSAMRTHKVSHLMTFNVSDFTRYPGITILDPKAITVP